MVLWVFMVGVYGDSGQTSRPLNKHDITRKVVLYYLRELEDTNPVPRPGFLAKYILGAKKAPTYVTLHVGYLLDKLIEQRLISKDHEWIHHKNTQKKMRVNVYQITPEAKEYLDTGVLPEGLPDSAYQWKENPIPQHEMRPVRNVSQVSIKEPTKTGVLETVKGIDYLENRGSESPDSVEVVPDIITDIMQEDITVEEDGSPISVYGVKYNWDDLRAEILKEFDTEYPLWYTNLDYTNGFSGAVYVRLDGDVFCVGYVDEDNNLVPGPEAMHVFFISKNAGKGKKPGRRALNSFFKGLDGSSGASGSFSKLMSNNIDEVTDRLYNGMYRNAGDLTTNKGNLSDEGQLFFDAVIELFGKDNFCVVDSMGKDHTTQYGSWFDINEYMPKNSVEPEGDEEVVVPLEKPRKRRTAKQIIEFLED